MSSTISPTIILKITADIINSNILYTRAFNTLVNQFITQGTSFFKSMVNDELLVYNKQHEIHRSTKAFTVTLYNYIDSTLNYVVAGEPERIALYLLNTLNGNSNMLGVGNMLSNDEVDKYIKYLCNAPHAMTLLMLDVLVVENASNALQKHKPSTLH